MSSVPKSHSNRGLKRNEDIEVSVCDKRPVFDGSRASDMDVLASPMDSNQVRRSCLNSDIARGELLTDQSLASHLTDLKPFLSPKIVDRLTKALDQKKIPDGDSVHQIIQPATITNGTLRDYQIRGVSLLHYVPPSTVPVRSKMLLGLSFIHFIF